MSQQNDRHEEEMKGERKDGMKVSSIDWMLLDCIKWAVATEQVDLPS